MSQLTLSELQKLARLAALELNEQELQSLGDDLEQILEYVRTLDTLDTSGVEPLSHPTTTEARMRHDQIRKELSVEAILSNAPQQQEEMFRVPPVLEADEE